MKKLAILLVAVVAFIPFVTLADFNTNLSTGSSGPEVTQLQQYLISKGLLNAQPTGYFGALTQTAVAVYQTIAGIAPASGYFGAITRAYINMHLGTSTSSSTIQSSTSAMDTTIPATQTTTTSTPCASPGDMYNTITGAPCHSGPGTATPTSSVTVLAPINDAAFESAVKNIYFKIMDGYDQMEQARESLTQKFPDPFIDNSAAALDLIPANTDASNLANEYNYKGAAYQNITQSLITASSNFNNAASEYQSGYDSTEGNSGEYHYNNANGDMQSAITAFNIIASFLQENSMPSNTLSNFSSSYMSHLCSNNNSGCWNQQI